MSILLDRVNSVPVMNNDFPYELNQWLANTVDTLNEVISDIEPTLISQSILDSGVSAVSVVVNTLYIPTNAALVSFQLPTVTSDDVGSIVEIAGQGAGGWRILTGTGQTINIASVNASASTSIASATRYDAIRIILVNATTWITLSAQTTGFVIV